MSTNEHNEQSELQKKLDKVTPEQLHDITPGQLFATVAAVGYLAEQMQKDQAPEPLPDVERQQAINLQPLPPLTILTSSQLDAKGKKLQAVALGDDPALNPSSPDFDPQAYKDKLQELAPQITDAYYTLRQYQNGVLQTMLDVMQPAVLEGMIKSPEIIKELGKTLQTMKAAVIDMLADALGEDESKELLPYIMQALDSPKYADTSEDTSAEDWQQLIQEARQLREDAERQQYTGKKTTKHNVLQSRELALPFDIFNEAQNNARNQINGQITMLPVAADHRQTVGKGKERHTITKELTSFYSISFADTLPPEIAKHLDYFDRLVYGAIDSVMHCTGCDIMTIPQIYRAMGYSGNPTQKQIDEIWHSLQKMQGAFIWYDFVQEQTAYPNSDYSNIGTKGQAGEALLSIKAVKVKMNGEKVDAIRVMDAVLPIYRAARARGHQVAAVPIECLQLPGKMRRENRTLAIVFAALEQISKMKHPRKTASDKLLYSTIYSKCGLPAEGGTATERKQRQRVRDTLFDYLEHLKKIGYIDGYRESKAGEAPGVTILYHTDALPGG